MSQQVLNVYQVLTEDDIERSHKAFIEFDVDQSGLIEGHELKRILEALGQKPTDQEIVHMISEIDENDSNSIDFSEFLQVMARQKLESNDKSRERDILDAWIAVGGGSDGSGCVDSELLVHILRETFQLSLDIEAELARLDEDGNGEVDFEEFQCLFANA